MDLHPSLSTSSSVKLGKSLDCSEPQFSHLKMGIIALHLHHCGEDCTECTEEVHL